MGDECGVGSAFDGPSGVNADFGSQPAIILANLRRWKSQNSSLENCPRDAAKDQVICSDHGFAA